MLKKSKIKKRAYNKTNDASQFIVIQVYAFIIYIFLFFVFGIICLLADLSKDYIYYVSLIMLILSSFITGFISGIKSRQNGLVTGILNAAPMISLVIIISLLFNGFNADFNTVISAIAGVAASAAGGIVSVNMKVRK